MQVERGSFYDPAEIFKCVQKQVKSAQKRGESIDYLTFVPDGEPTVDINLGREIDLLKSLGIKIGVITNGSLIFDEDVINDIMKADWVSLKVDSTWETRWRRINRPHQDLKLTQILGAMHDFSKSFRGELVTETMLVRGSSNDVGMLKEMAMFLSTLRPDRSYLSIPTRPPAESWVECPVPEEVNTAFQIFSEKIDQVAYLIGYEGNEFAYLGDVEKNLLSITSVHPMRENAVRNFLAKAGKDWTIINKLVSKEKIVVTEYSGQKFYLRNFNPKPAG
jgi:wyosine [tRNA(Phe)-imidazoG37] synthetase (radical SAM superfamily)